MDELLSFWRSMFSSDRFFSEIDVFGFEGVVSMKRFLISCRGVLAVGLFGGVFGGHALGLEQFATGPKNRGIKTIGRLQVFPENRQDNAVYFRNRLVLTLPGKTIVDVAPISRTGRFVYIARDGESVSTFNANLGPKDQLVRITEITEGIFHMRAMIRGVAYKKLYRMSGGSILDALPNSKTAEGPAASPEGVVFYHVASISNAETDAEAPPIYTLRLHFLPAGGDTVRHLPRPIFSTTVGGQLRWLSKTRIRFDFGQGKSAIFNTAQFK